MILSVMTDLSPAAQAVLDAFLRAPCDNELSVAAALRAAADQVVPPAVILEYYERNESPVLGKAIEVRNKFLAIAAELNDAKSIEPNNSIKFGDQPAGMEEVTRLDKEGFHYRGQFIADAGEAHRLLVEYLKQNIQPEPERTE
jgi:hypothetical protein